MYQFTVLTKKVIVFNYTLLNSYSIRYGISQSAMIFKSLYIYIMDLNGYIWCLSWECGISSEPLFNSKLKLQKSMFSLSLSFSLKFQVASPNYCLWTHFSVSKSYKLESPKNINIRKVKWEFPLETEKQHSIHNNKFSSAPAFAIKLRDSAQLFESKYSLFLCRRNYGLKLKIMKKKYVNKVWTFKKFLQFG